MAMTKKQQKIIIPIAAVLIAAIVFAACLPMLLRRSEINPPSLQYEARYPKATYGNP